MKKLLNINFDWKESWIMFDGNPTYLLTTRVGSLPLGKEVHVFPSDRGFYNGNENPLVFNKDLESAKKHVEDQLLIEMKK